MEIYELMLKRRSIRSFQQTPLTEEVLRRLVNAARLAPSAANLQPLEYILVAESATVAEVFTTLKWALYITPKGIPAPGKKPVAYIVVLANTNIKKSAWDKDVGAAVENIIITALAEGIGSCWLESIEREQLGKILEVPPHLIINSVVALGYPAEEPIKEEMTSPTASIKYWKDETGQLHVPKRRLKDILYYDKYGSSKS